jgi:hypothetical protein
MFTDRLGTGGSEHNVAVKLATRELVVAFLDALWRDGGDALPDWQQRHAALLSPLQAEALPRLASTSTALGIGATAP